MQSSVVKQLVRVPPIARNGLSMARIRHRRTLLCFTLLILTGLLVINLGTLWNRSANDDFRDYLTAGPSLYQEDYENREWINSQELLHLNLANGSSVFNTYYRLQWSVNRKQWPLAKPWFMHNGTVKPSSQYSLRLALWPEQVLSHTTDPNSDRIVNQLMYVPPGYNANDYVPKGKLPLKKILLYFGKNGWGDLKLGRSKFLQDRCPVNTCFIEGNADLIEQADAVIFKDRFSWPRQGRTKLSQVWIMFLLECPMHTQQFTSLPAHVFNWTATYRHDSDIVAPYEKYVSYHSLTNHTDIETHFASRVDLFESTIYSSTEKPRNYASGKTKKVAWFVSNCGARNKRLEYARELSKHIEVDIYGSCGKMKCPRSNTDKCFDMLDTDYKFYLAFENSNCRDYITEKFFVNGLGQNSARMNVVPIVMGGRPEDYRRSAPPHSYIHVDDFRSPAELALYLTKLDQNDEEYNQYFAWKSSPREGEFVNTYFWCRLCALLHAPPTDHKPSVSYDNIAQWWAPKNVCTDGTHQWPTIFNGQP